MRFILGLFLAIGCATTSHAQSKYDALVKEYDDTAKAFRTLLQATKQADVAQVYRDTNPQPKFALRFLDVAKQQPKTPEAYASLVWIAENSELIPAAAKPYADAMTLLAEKFADHKDNERLFDRLAISPFASAAPFLKAVFEKHPSSIVRGRAGFHESYRCHYDAAVVRHIVARRSGANPFRANAGHFA